jgi:hypothetical protein
MSPGGNGRGGGGSLALAPEVVLQLWDWDRFSANDLCANLRVALDPGMLVTKASKARAKMTGTVTMYYYVLCTARLE